MAQFTPAYKIVAKWEGGYANNPNDSGGETFAGITRRFNDSWPGWPRVDQLLASGGRQAVNADSELRRLAKKYYQDRWDASGFGGFASQELANIVFDWSILTTTKSAFILLYRSLGKSVPGNIDYKKAVDVANQADATTAVAKYKELRVKHHTANVLAYPRNKEFLEGWLKRTDEFGKAIDAGRAPGGGSGLLIGLGALGLLVLGGLLIVRNT